MPDKYWETIRLVRLARLGQAVIEQEIRNDRESAALRFLTKTFQEIEHAAGTPLKVAICKGWHTGDSDGYDRISSNTKNTNGWA